MNPEESATSPRSPDTRLSWRKRILFSLVTMLLMLAIAEGIAIAWVTFAVRDSWDGLYMQQRTIAEGGSPQDGIVEVIHPYLGWAMNPDIDPGARASDIDIPVNRLGFNDVEHGIPHRAPGRLVLAVVGGSVAWQFSVYGEQAFRKKFQEDKRFRNIEIEIVRLAMPGYKQPQQVMALAWLLSLGAEFDAVVNLDGYNEIALPVCENHLAKVNTAYPRMWHARLQNVVDPRAYAFSFRLLQARALRQESAVAIRQSWWNWSAIRNLLWLLRNQQLSQQIVEFGEEIRTHEHRFGRGFASDGPMEQFADEQELFARTAALWRDSSLQLQSLCRGSGATYVHCLQPNQYIEGTKPMGNWEREKMIEEGQLYGQAIARGYPLLIEAGRTLKERGVAFHDLTRLFVEIEEPLYRDPFCHLNPRGNDLLAEAIAERLLSELSRVAEPGAR